MSLPSLPVQKEIKPEDDKVNVWMLSPALAASHVS
jgi:hypothetical protein